MGKRSTSNVVLFPANRVVNPQQTVLHADVVPETLDEIFDAYDILKARKAGELLEVAVPLIIQAFAAYGLNPMAVDPRYLGMVQESVRSLAFKIMGVDHPLQPLCENLFNINDGELKITTLKVKTRKKSVKKKDEDDAKTKD